MPDEYVCHECGKLNPGKPALTVRAVGLTVKVCPRCKADVVTWDVVEDVEDYVRRLSRVSG